MTGCHRQFARRMAYAGCMILAAGIMAWAGCSDGGTGPDNWSYTYFAPEGCSWRESGANYQEECLHFQYTNDGRLWLEHTDLYWMCCPDTVILSEITLEGTDLVIHEWAEGSNCNCICPYNLAWEIRRLPPGIYSVSVILFNNLHLAGTLDLRLPGSGVFCE